MCTGFLPTCVALPALMAMFLGPTVDIGGEVFIEAFLDYISQVDRCIVNEAFEISGSTFSDPQKVIDILSMYACRQVQTPGRPRETLLQVSKYIFQSKPLHAVSGIYSGVPELHKPFWSAKTPDAYAALYHSIFFACFVYFSSLSFATRQKQPPSHT